jgi:hypothetical protein
MVILGLVSRSEPVEVNGKHYHNLAIEGFSLVPGKELRAYPQRDQVVECTVSCYWPRKGGRPIHFLTDWKALSALPSNNGSRPSDESGSRPSDESGSGSSDA